LSEFADKLLTQISNYKTKIENGSITADELQKLKEVTLAYFAFQKEVAVATYTLGSIRSDNPDAIRRLIQSNIM